MDSLTIRNARLVTCAGPDAGSNEQKLGVIDHGALCIEKGTISYAGPDADCPSLEGAPVLDAEGRIALPGLVDPHTHLAFAGSRVVEMARRLAGVDYRTIANEGGGIAATVHATRSASDEELYEGTRSRARHMSRLGVTAIEIKSGYGLTVTDEVRQLEAARRLARDGLCRVTTTFLGAHTVAPELRDDRQRYLDIVVDEMLPRVVERRLADACDAYIDDGAFTLEEGARVLRAAARLGLPVRGHVGQFADLGGPELLAELGALSADHLEEVSDTGLAAMATAGVTAVLLPGAWSTLRQEPPSAERLRRFGVAMAVGTDCNPGTSPCVDLPLCAALAVRNAGLTLEEAVLAVTRHAAHAAGIANVGRLTVGYHGDVALFDHDDPRAIGYALGGSPTFCTILAGSVVSGHESAETVSW